MFRPALAEVKAMQAAKRVQIIASCRTPRAPSSCGGFVEDVELQNSTRTLDGEGKFTGGVPFVGEVAPVGKVQAWRGGVALVREDARGAVASHWWREVWCGASQEFGAAVNPTCTAEERHGLDKCMDGESPGGSKGSGGAHMQPNSIATVPLCDGRVLGGNGSWEEREKQRCPHHFR
jgi:hypothetical protein